MTYVNIPTVRYLYAEKLRGEKLIFVGFLKASDEKIGSGARILSRICYPV
jgi:hypothetical protein